jgi:hypothetical protein
MAAAHHANPVAHRAVQVVSGHTARGGRHIGVKLGIDSSGELGRWRDRGQRRRAIEREGEDAPLLSAIADAVLLVQHAESRTAGVVARQNRHVLAASDAVADGRRDDRRARGIRPEQLAAVGGIGIELAVDLTLKHQIAAGGQRTPVPK